MRPDESSINLGCARNRHYLAGIARTNNILMEVARIEGFRCCKAARHYGYFRGLWTAFPNLQAKRAESQKRSGFPIIQLRFLDFKFCKLGFWFLDISSVWGIEYSCVAFPLTPTLSPRRGGSSACPRQIAAALTWCVAAWLPLLGERVGVRGNVIDARNELINASFSYPPKVSRNHFLGVWSFSGYE